MSSASKPKSLYVCNSMRIFKSKELGLSIETIVDSKGGVFFKGKDVALALGYEKPRNAIATHVDNEYKTKGALIQGSLKGAQPETIWISEPGVYSLIFGSKLKSAKAFQKWVFSEVLPKIREYGYLTVLIS